MSACLTRGIELWATKWAVTSVAHLQVRPLGRVALNLLEKAREVDHEAIAKDVQALGIRDATGRRKDVAGRRWREVERRAAHDLKHQEPREWLDSSRSKEKMKKKEKSCGGGGGQPAIQRACTR